MSESQTRPLTLKHLALDDSEVSFNCWNTRNRTKPYIHGSDEFRRHSREVLSHFLAGFTTVVGKHIGLKDNDFGVTLTMDNNVIILHISLPHGLSKDHLQYLAQ